MTVRLVFAGLVLVHALIHLLGVAKGFGLAEVEALATPISRTRAAGWLVAAVALAVSAVLVVTHPREWWWVGAPAALLSQLLVVSAWADARAGTLVNVVILAASGWAWAAYGPPGLRAEARRLEADARAAMASRRPGLLGDEELAVLPEPVRRYVRRSGAVGAPRSAGVRVTWRGRIRAGTDDPWMPFVAEQQNVWNPPSRVFFMDARRGGLPVDVLHVFDAADASMHVRLLSVVSLVRAEGADLHRTETVTFLNDLVLLAPSALVDPSLRWTAVDGRSARVRFGVGADTVEAMLVVDEAGDLVDFVSDDRAMALPDGGGFAPRRWSTPVEAHGPAGPLRLVRSGRGLWHLDDGPFAYIELERTGFTSW